MKSKRRWPGGITSEDWVMLVSGDEGTEPRRSVPASWERSLGDMTSCVMVVGLDVKDQTARGM